MKKNKYDLVEDIAWMLHEMEDCKACFMARECPWRQCQGEEELLCANVNELTEAIEKKYLR